LKFRTVPRPRQPCGTCLEASSDNVSSALAEKEMVERDIFVSYASTTSTLVS
jgi:hypothetical protein